MGHDIIFPNIGVRISNLDPVAFTVFGFEIYWYAIFVVIGIIAGYYFGGVHAPKKTGQNPDDYTNIAIWVIPISILGGRLFYLLFSPWPAGAGFFHLFNIRAGGIAIWGVIITAVVVSFVYTRRKKFNFLNFLDTAIVGLIIGHVIGRFGNFVNREAFGGYASDAAPFAMQLRIDQVRSPITDEIVQNIVSIGGFNYIQVHPVFFYEAAINLALFVFLLIYRKHKKFNGELIAMYFVSYGITRFFLEFMRTDALMVGGSNIAVAHILSGGAALGGIAFLAMGYIKHFKKA
ncbi:MAG: prolipoprotein diacylglyceryl transferase [Defluviitaleaceae bacterium]|nr:prolipoprotein diacylglyceryl transferase [Defluviitaleaceae bacterium]